SPANRFGAWYSSRAFSRDQVNAVQEGVEIAMGIQGLDGRIALVTGAARGMGRATALTLAQRGAAVAVNDTRRASAEAVAAEIEAAGGRALACIADVSDEGQVEAMVAAVVAHFGTVDILVNNAGILRATSPLEMIPLEE